jgi:hypothetical protein
MKTGSTRAAPRATLFWSGGPTQQQRMEANA